MYTNSYTTADIDKIEIRFEHDSGQVNSIIVQSKGGIVLLSPEDLNRINAAYLSAVADRNAAATPEVVR